jgi:uncharacterized membrane protein
MRDTMLIIHFIGLAMGLGTSIGFMILGISGSKMEENKLKQFVVDVLPLGKMGQLGLVLLIISGGYLMTPHWSQLGEMPLLIVKLCLVVVLAIVILLIASAGKKAKNGAVDAYLKKVPVLGRVSLLVALAIVVLAVMVFH